MSDFEPYTPEIQNPYSDEWTEISNFSYDSHFYLARAKEAIAFGEGRESEYIVSSEYTCSCKVDGQHWEIRVPSGMLTDLASVPWIARGLVERVGPHLEAAIVHDFLFIAWQDLPDHGYREQDFRFSNALMMQAMLAAEVGAFRRNAIFLAISSFIAHRAYRRANPGVRYVRVPDEIVETAALLPQYHKEFL